MVVAMAADPHGGDLLVANQLEAPADFHLKVEDPPGVYPDHLGKVREMLTEEREGLICQGEHALNKGLPGRVREGFRAEVGIVQVRGEGDVELTSSLPQKPCLREVGAYLLDGQMGRFLFGQGQQRFLR